MARSLRTATTSALAVAAAIGAVWAAEPAEPVRLSHHRGGGACPDADAFFRSIAARTPRVRAARPGERARTVTVSLSASPGGEAVGTLSITTEDGAAVSSPREVRAASCADVAEALALIAALAVDPAADLGPAPRSSAAPASPTVAPPVSSSVGAPLPPAPSSAPASAPPPPTPSVASSAAVARAAPLPSGSPVEVGLGLGPEVSSLFGATLALGFAAHVERDVVGAWSPRLSLGGARTLGGDVSGGGRSASLAMTSAVLLACPTRARAGAWSALPCARVAIGRVGAEAKGLSAPERKARDWLDFGAGVRAAWRPGGWLSIEPWLELRVPVTRDRFYVEPDATVYRAPAVVPAAGMELTAHFP